MVWSGTLRHRPENSPNTKVRQTLCDGKWELQRTERPWRPHQQLQSDICLFYSPSVVTRSVSLSFPFFSTDTNESDTFVIQSTCVLFKLLCVGDADQMTRFAFLDITVYFCAWNIALENLPASKLTAAKRSKIHNWSNAIERAKHTRPITVLYSISIKNISLVG